MKQLRSSLLLLLSAIIWGSAFVAQSEGAKTLDAFTFNAVRMTLGGIVLIPCIYLINRFNKDSDEKKPNNTKALLIGGISCGVILFLGTTLQQIGLEHTSAGKAGFITTLYIVLVPLVGIFFRKKVPFYVWIGVIFAGVGLYLLCVKENFTVERSDFLIFICAFAFTAHILVIDYFASNVDAVKMSCIQFFVAGLISAVFMLMFGNPTISGIKSAWVEIAYMGIMSNGIAYTVQIVAQKDVDPTIASLLMSMESVFAALSGWLIQGAVLSQKELLGCALMFLAIILSQLPEKRIKVLKADC